MATKTVNQSTVKPVLRGHPWGMAISNSIIQGDCLIQVPQNMVIYRNNKKTSFYVTTDHSMHKNLLNNSTIIDFRRWIWI